MIKVGLTGNIGSGKTVVSEVYKTIGIPTYNADMRGSFFIDSPEVINDLKKLFGSDIIGKDLRPDRKKIADIVFNEPQKLQLLNSIIHPLVLADFEKWSSVYSKTGYVILESAILFETGYSSLFDKIIFVSAPEEIRLKRVMDRDGVTEAHVKSRMKQQQAEKDKIQKADFVIVNDGKRSLIEQVLSVHKRILEVIPAS